MTQEQKAIVIPARRQRRKFLLILPVFVLPFLAGAFFALGGGQGNKDPKAATASIGLNPSLPAPTFDLRKPTPDKRDLYEKANQDSLRKKEYAARDPYHTDSIRADHPGSAGFQPVHSTPLTTRTTIADPRADQLLLQLRQLQESLHKPAENPITQRQAFFPPQPEPPIQHPRPADTPETDPQLARLNTMLDKVIRIQHPAAVNSGESLTPNSTSDHVLPADSSGNVLTAVVPTGQILITGNTIALRLTEDVLVSGQLIRQGQFVYGIVTINNDRMTVRISALRTSRSLYPVDLQVYDLDGLPGIHIPGLLTRDVAKSSADEATGAFNPLTYDPSLGAQAANVGIQTAKSFLSHKARLVRASVPAGYRVLLRNADRAGRSLPPKPESEDSSKAHVSPPSFISGEAFLEISRSEKVEAGLHGIYLKDSLLWFALELRNHSPINYIPEYLRWYIRDRRVLKRTAIQELPVTPVYAAGLKQIPAGTELDDWIGFRPFAIARDKELVLEIGESGGARPLILIINHKEILNAKTLTHEQVKK
jgi:hypothetical protein